MVDSAAALAPEAEIERSYAEVIEECGVIRPRTERPDSHIAPLAVVSALFAPARARRVENRAFAFGVVDGARDVVDEPFERVRPRRVEPAFAGAICIDVDDRLPLQLLGMLFRPFGRGVEAEGGRLHQ